MEVSRGLSYRSAANSKAALSRSCSSSGSTVSRGSTPTKRWNSRVRILLARFALRPRHDNPIVHGEGRHAMLAHEHEHGPDNGLSLTVLELGPKGRNGL